MLVLSEFLPIGLLPAIAADLNISVSRSPSSLPGVFALFVIWGFVWGALPLGLQTWMSQAAPGASDGSLALFVTTIQLAISAGTIIGGPGVGAFGIAFDFYLGGDRARGPAGAAGSRASASSRAS